MNNFLEFGRMFNSYLLLLIVIFAVAGLGMFIGIKIRKSKDAKEERLNAQSSETEN